MQSVTVWDLPTRIFHWSLVFFFSVSYLSGDEFEELHSYSGYIIIGLLLFRVIWGFIGSRHARFSDFIYPRHVIIEYTQSLLKEVLIKSLEILRDFKGVDSRRAL